ncbi:MAG: pilin [Patescibacteria group bacterium]|jgi:hypothetical protein
MKKSLSFFLGLVLATNLFSFTLAPVTFAANDQVGQLIKNQLQPVEEIYGSQDVRAETFSEAIAKIIKIVLGFLGILFLVLILYAGFNWMTSAGNEERITTAKKTMVAATIGVAIVLAAYIITYFVIDQLMVATTNHGLPS